MKMRKSLIAAMLFLPTAVMALTLNEARQQGRVGETFSGYVAPVTSDTETHALVGRINQARKQEYQALAKKNNMTENEVGRIAGQKLVERAAVGEYVRGINGQWLKKDH